MNKLTDIFNRVSLLSTAVSLVCREPTQTEPRLIFLAFTSYVLGHEGKRSWPDSDSFKVPAHLARDSPQNSHEAYGNLERTGRRNERVGSRDW